jgi:hypothetical protein
VSLFLLVLLLQGRPPTVGDTIWVRRQVPAAAGVTVRAADWKPEGDVELLGPAEVTRRGETVEVAYPLVVWRPGQHRLEVPGPLRLGTDGTVDSLPAQVLQVGVASVLPDPAVDSAPAPQPAVGIVRRSTASPLPLLVLAVLATLLLLPLHLWWRRRGPPLGAAPAAAPAPVLPLERWAAAGESRAVLAAVTARLRAAIAAREPEAHPALDTEALLALLGPIRSDWPLGELGELLRALDAARFAPLPPADAVGLSRRADEIGARLLGRAA